LDTLQLKDQARLDDQETGDLFRCVAVRLCCGKIGQVAVDNYAQAHQLPLGVELNFELGVS